MDHSFEETARQPSARHMAAHSWPAVCTLPALGTPGSIATVDRGLGLPELRSLLEEIR